MPYSRNTRRTMFLNDDRGYKDTFFRQRDIVETFQYDVARIAFPDAETINSLNNISMAWGATDTLYNLAYKYYGSPSYWWIIAWYNEKATEAEFTPGEVFYIPLPLDDVLGFFG